MGLCKNCNQREGTVNWVGDGGDLAFSHGFVQKWCLQCCTEVQLDHARECAARIPELESKLNKLKHERDLKKEDN